METFWLVGRKDMAEANDSMVCKFVPRKKKPGEKKKKPPRKKKEQNENGGSENAASLVGQSTLTLQVDSESGISSRKSSMGGISLLAQSFTHMLTGFKTGKIDVLDTTQKKDTLLDILNASVHKMDVDQGTSDINDTADGGNASYKHGTDERGPRESPLKSSVSNDPATLLPEEKLIDEVAKGNVQESTSGSPLVTEIV